MRAGIPEAAALTNDILYSLLMLCNKEYAFAALTARYRSCQIRCLTAHEQLKAMLPILQYSMKRLKVASSNLVGTVNQPATSDMTGAIARYCPSIVHAGAIAIRLDTCEPSARTIPLRPDASLSHSSTSPLPIQDNGLSLADDVQYG